ncbi:MAG TPA: hypothetical protein VGU69_04885 [Rhizomicrobium sp.]|nr:hypothetical protein [Rhizomicrobium sp.]
MKNTLIAAAAVAIALAAPALADTGGAGPEKPGGNVCLKTSMIDTTKVIDAKTLDFRMRNGTVWRNALRGSCPSLKFNGFVYSTNYPEICGNLQSIRVLKSQTICLLGPFTKMPKTAG